MTRSEEWRAEAKRERELEAMRLTIKDFAAYALRLEREAVQAKRSVNYLCEMAGEPPVFCELIDQAATKEAAGPSDPAAPN